MNYNIYKLTFQSAVHFGDGGLTKGRSTLYADTIFSALCQEALKIGCLETLIEKTRKNCLRISDGLPYIGDTYYIPKPLVSLTIEKNGDSKEKKELKKLEYIPEDQLDLYLKGEMDIRKERKKFSEQFGKPFLVEKAAVHETKDSEPYAVSTFTFGKNSGLYVIVGTEEEDVEFLISGLFDSLGYEGIGGKRSAGYGKFTAKVGKMESRWKERLVTGEYERYCSLSTCIPREDEMEKSLENSRYRLVKRSGFVDSDHYAQSFRKKKDSYLLMAGSSFENKFDGELLDVSIDGKHPVYRYAKSLLMGVK
ncbi:MAG: type III-A CRISPR-associated RAMP protein Csm4 [Anaerobutyricum sp.]|nr:type III-A CRISPR-associated RAMP protein Csm4 [Anaerobutyricum sp.]